MATVTPLTAGGVVTEASLDPATGLLLVVAVALYAVGVRRLAARGRYWPVGRTVAFASGIVVLAVATQSGLASYDTVLFSIHVGQHLLIGMVAPLLIVLGAPVTLALQASNRPTQTTLVAALHHPVVRGLTHPLVAVALFTVTLFVLYLSPLYELSLRNDLLHTAVHIHFLGAGLLFFVATLGVEPSPWRIGYPARLGLVVFTIPLHAFLGIALMSGETALAADYYSSLDLSWSLDPVAQQKIGGAILWAVGDLFAVSVVLVLMLGWMNEDARVATRADRRLHEVAA